MYAGPKKKADTSPLPWKSRAKGENHFRLFCQKYLKVPRGKGAKTTFKPRPWQLDLVAGLLDPAGAHTNVWVLPRGNGKSGLAAAVGLHHLFCSGLEGARVAIIAQDERRAKALLKTAIRMIQLEPELAARAVIYQDRIEVPGTDSTLMALPGEAHRVEGEDLTLAIVDEVGFVPADTFEAALLSTGKREGSKLLAIGTPSPPKWRDRSPLLGLVLTGRAGDDPTVSVTEFGADPQADIMDPATWASANPAYGDWLTEDAIRAQAPPKTRQTEFRRARLGIWVEHDDSSFVTAEQWKQQSRPGVKIPPGSNVVLSLDGSQRGDSTALLVLSVSPVPHVQIGGLWEPSKEKEGYEVDVDEVENQIRALSKLYRVQELVADPWGWNRTLQILAKEGMNVSQFNQNTARLTPATVDLHSAIIGGGITHDGDPRLAKHVLAATVDETDRGIRLKKQTKNQKIDCAASLVMGFSRAQWLASQTKKRGRVRSYRR